MLETKGPVVMTVIDNVINHVLEILKTYGFSEQDGRWRRGNVAVSMHKGEGEVFAFVESGAVACSVVFKEVLHGLVKRYQTRMSCEKKKDGTVDKDIDVVYKVAGRLYAEFTKEAIKMEKRNRGEDETLFSLALDVVYHVLGESGFTPVDAEKTQWRRGGATATVFAGKMAKTITVVLKGVIVECSTGINLRKANAGHGCRTKGDVLEVSEEEVNVVVDISSKIYVEFLKLLGGVGV